MKVSMCFNLEKYFPGHCTETLAAFPWTLLSVPLNENFIDGVLFVKE